MAARNMNFAAASAAEGAQRDHWKTPEGGKSTNVHPEGTARADRRAGPETQEASGRQPGGAEN